MSAPASKQEQEVKIQPQANLQFKYTNIAAPEVFSRQAETLLEILSLSYEHRGRKTLVDNYYDFSDFRLKAAGYSLRMRRGEGDGEICTITLKHQTGSLPFERGMQRDEVEMDVHERKRGGAESWESLVEVPEVLFSKLWPGAPFATSGQLLYTGSVHNERSNIDFRTPKGLWRLSYDRFYYFKGQYNDASEFTRYFCEVEIELLSGETGAFQADQELGRLIKALVSIFGMEESKTSKLKRGMQCHWGGKPEIAIVHVLGVDIVGYSKRVPEIQLQLIQKLNKWIKDSLLEARHKAGISSHDQFTVYIPTGDGMYLVFDRPEDATLIPDILARVYQKATEYNRIIVGNDKQIHCRFGLHVGPVFKYSDINEELNFAGNGLNVAARILSKAESGQLLVSIAAKEFLEAFVDSNSRMSKLGTVVVKHGLEIEVWNYHDKDNAVGLTHDYASQCF